MPFSSWGGFGFALAAAANAGAVGFWTLLAALVIGNPASGAFVSLSQATLMDSAPAQRERNMARWTLAGSFGYVGGPVVLAAALWIGVGWRGALVALAVTTIPLLVVLPHLPRAAESEHESLRASLASALAALRIREVQRWLLTLEALDLLGDVLHGYLALYFVDVAHVSPAAAALGVGVWTGASLVGDWLLLHVLRRASGFAYLRATAVAALAVYPAFLLVPGLAPKLVLVAALGLLNSGWYAVPQAALYAALSGTKRCRGRGRRRRRPARRDGAARPRRHGRGGRARRDDVGPAARAAGAARARAASLIGRRHVVGVAVRLFRIRDR